MDYIDGIEYNDRFISDRAVDVLDTLAYLQLIGSYDVRNRIILEYNDFDNIKHWVYLRNGVIDNEGERKKYRVDTDDITKDIVHLLLKIDKNIFDLVIGEFNIEEEKKYYGFKYPTYAPCIYWDERREKIRDENFIQIICKAKIWNGFVKIKRHRGLTLEELFKIAIIRFLEKRYDLCLQELRSENSAYNKEWVME